MLRRDFLRRLATTAAGLLVADDALELLAEPRKYWPGADFGGPGLPSRYYSTSELAALLHKVFKEHVSWHLSRPGYLPLFDALPVVGRSLIFDADLRHSANA